LHAEYFLENHFFHFLSFFFACLHLPSSSYHVTLKSCTLNSELLFFFSICKACFRQNITVVTIYASLGEEALCHSLNEVSTVTCMGIPCCSCLLCFHVICFSWFIKSSRQNQSVLLVAFHLDMPHGQLICISCIFFRRMYQLRLIIPDTCA
jgi:hypothetical protein